jgi:carbonic anhydrase
MIYSEIFDTMHPAARSRVQQRLQEVLSGKDQSPKFAHLSINDRRTILEILLDTKPGLGF